MATITTDSLSSAREAWEQAEWRARAAFALTRLDSLDRLAADLIDADRFDAAYVIWDDYIDGRRDDERIEDATRVELVEAAMVFARVARYLDGKNVVALAQIAWGVRTFEVLLFDSPANFAPVGKFGWYTRQQTVVVKRSVPCECGASIVSTDTFSPHGVARSAVHGGTVALHPVFGAAA